MLQQLNEDANVLPNQRKPRVKYRCPDNVSQITMNDLFAFCERSVDSKQKLLFAKANNPNPVVYYSGNLDLLKCKSVSVIGSRKVSEEGLRRAAKIASQLASAGIITVSGLAKGVDTAAHNGALSNGGNTVAVIGTPIDRAYPADNAELQQHIAEKELLISQFPIGSRTFPSDFPKRNKLMAAVSDGSIIVEASDSSGTLHQAAECVRLGRWLFVMKSVVDDQKLEWPTKFLSQPNVAVLETVQDVVQRIS